MNETIRIMRNHRSIRKYKPDPVPPELFESIMRAAQMASTSTNMQAYSVIAVTDPEDRNRLAELCGDQKFIAGCPLFLVWCADLHRLERVHRLRRGEDPPWLNTMENFIVATVDASLAAQNAALAAESLGLGIVFVGGIRNRIREVTELLRLPKLVYPVFGMCMGYPDQDVILRPRLPLAAVLHHGQYSSEGLEEHLTAYDESISNYMRERTRGRLASTWSEIMAGKLEEPVRLHMRQYLEEQGFGMK